MSKISLETQLFDKNLEIKKLHEKIEYLAGGTTAAEMLDVLRERDENIFNLEDTNKKLQERCEKIEEKYKNFSIQYKCLTTTLEKTLSKNTLFDTEINRVNELLEIKTKEFIDVEDELKSVIDQKTREVLDLKVQQADMVKQNEIEMAELRQELKHVNSNNILLQEQFKVKEADMIKLAERERTMLENKIEKTIIQMRRMEKTLSNTIEGLEAGFSACKEELEISQSKAKKLEKCNKDLHSQITDRDRRLEYLEQSEQKLAARSELEIEVLQQELAKCRHKLAESMRLVAENTELKAKVERQEAFMRKRIGQENKTRIVKGDENFGTVANRKFVVGRSIAKPNPVTRDSQVERPKKRKALLSNFEKAEIERKRKADNK